MKKLLKEIKEIKKELTIHKDLYIGCNCDLCRDRESILKGIKLTVKSIDKCVEPFIKYYTIWKEIKKEVLI